jgi:hypothetical protein
MAVFSPPELTVQHYGHTEMGCRDLARHIVDRKILGRFLTVDRMNGGMHHGQ